MQFNFSFFFPSFFKVVMILLSMFASLANCQSPNQHKTRTYNNLIMKTTKGKKTGKPDSVFLTLYLKNNNYKWLIVALVLLAYHVRLLQERQASVAMALCYRSLLIGLDFRGIIQ